LCFVAVQLRALVQSNPAALPVVLQQIGAATPQLLEVINAVRGARTLRVCVGYRDVTDRVRVHGAWLADVRRTGRRSLRC
jgi:hypothetical protein